MAERALTPDQAEKAFWEHLKHSSTGMLGLDRPGYHNQPMTAFRDERDGALWFFTHDNTDLARDVAGGGPEGGTDAMFTYGSKDQEVWACIHGRLSLQRDAGVIDRHWNAVVAAWYPEGKADPHLALLRFDGDDGRIWVSQKGPVGFLFEVAKASLTKAMPETGGVADVNLR